ncbi:hypothetical protein HPB50_021831 [Hyalomma asiaticum]|uniref:Uncharacterized protein n=1 Tax=Hyalomma asiaticum TaxID=266040 RepID=A0ACB7TNN9_HYAAI|nr:hypothetical protein HPB50_021831 [Hyalomma asiaticum]
MEEPSPAVRGPPVPENQREMLLAFLEQYPSLAQRSFTATPYFTAADRRRLWKDIAEALNAEGPTQKTSEQWQVWWRKQVFAARHDSRAVEEAQSTGSGRLPGYRGRILQVCGLSRFTGSRRLDYQTRRGPHNNRFGGHVHLGHVGQMCLQRWRPSSSRTLDQGINMLAVGGPLHIRKFRA